MGFQGGTQVAWVVKNPPANVGAVGDKCSIPGSGRSPGGGNWQPTPVFLPGESHGQRSLEGYSPWGQRVRHMSINLVKLKETINDFFFLTEQCPNLKWNIVDFFSLKLTSSFFLYAAHFLFCLVLFFKCVCLWRKHVENLCIAIKQRLLLLCHYRCRWLTRNDYLKPYVSVFFSELLPLCIPTGVHKCIFVSLA